ncbi:MAG TPA: DUF3800 domain-containing protein [bacterium]
MSVLVFVEQGRLGSSGATEYYATVAGAAIEEVAYDDFSRKLLRLKERFFKRKGVADYPIKGRLLLSGRALSANFRKVEFVKELFSLCRLLKITSFSTTKKFSVGAAAQPGVFATGLPKSAVLDSNGYSEEAISILLAYLIERVNSFMLENHPGQVAKLIFRTEETSQDYLRGHAFLNFIYGTRFGGGFHGILGAPLLMPSALSAGLQLADIFAYAANRYHAGFRDIVEFYQEIADMQFISAISKDEYELKGMNLIE